MKLQPIVINEKPRSLNEVFGSGIGIRTPTNRVRVCRATVTQFGIALGTYKIIALYI